MAVVVVAAATAASWCVVVVECCGCCGTCDRAGSWHVEEVTERELKRLCLGGVWRYRGGSETDVEEVFVGFERFAEEVDGIRFELVGSGGVVFIF